MSERFAESRRHFRWGAAATGGGLILSACSSSSQSAAKPVGVVMKEGEKEEISPAEDLMRERRIQKRILLIHREGTRRIESKQELHPEALSTSANLIRRFIEDYHEKLEEGRLFPRFRRADSLVGPVDVLEAQYKRGRGLTASVFQLSTTAALKNAQDLLKLSNAPRLFVRMYESHEAREDTVLFPAFRNIVPANEYASPGGGIEKKEHELFGEEGFEKNVDRVAGLQKLLGIYDLSQFAPAWRRTERSDERNG